MCTTLVIHDEIALIKDFHSNTIEVIISRTQLVHPPTSRDVNHRIRFRIGIGALEDGNMDPDGGAVWVASVFQYDQIAAFDTDGAVKSKLTYRRLESGQ